MTNIVPRSLSKTGALTMRHSPLLATWLVLGTATPCLAQHQHDHAASASAPAEISPRARQQVREVQAAVQALNTPEAARAAGFRPTLGWIPSMGTHWVSGRRMRDGFDLREPDHLMFSPVNGSLQLVGVAYAFRGSPNAVMPDGFDGSLDRWHDHPFLAPGDETLHMLHVWFVPSPDGTFAGHNPWLPFWAAGVEPPDIARMQDTAAARRVRGLSAALAITAEPMPLDRLLTRGSAAGVSAQVQLEREAIRRLIPGLQMAQASGELATWDQLADSAGAHWRTIRTAYLASARRPQGREFIGRVLDQVVGGEGGGHH
jgi:hypothetical protein